jgi:hypothetical protein
VRCSDDSRVRRGIAASGWWREAVHKAIAFGSNSEREY